MSSADTRVTITGDASGLFKALAESSKATQTMAKEMETAAGGLKNLLTGFAAPLLAMTAVFGGKEFLKGTIDETKNWTVEAQKLARVLGITTEQASVLNLAIGDIYGTQEEYLTAVAKLTKTLNTNEEAFKNLGVATRDSSGNLRDTPSIMADVNGALANLKSGTDRNVASAQIYGKSWIEVQRYLKLTPEVMQAAQEKAEKLNLIVGQDAVAAAEAYRASMNDLDDTIKGLKIRVGNELMPVLTTLNEMLSDGGPEAIGVLSTAITQFNLLAVNTAELWFKVKAGFKVGFEEIADNGSTFLESVKALATGGIAASRKVWESANQRSFVRNLMLDSENELMGEYFQSLRDKLEGNAMGPKQSTGGSGTGRLPKGGEDPDMKAWLAYSKIIKEEAALRKERQALWAKHQDDMYEVFGDELDREEKKINDHYDEMLRHERSFGNDEQVLREIEVGREVAIQKMRTEAAAKAAEERRKIEKEEAEERRRLLEETGTAQQGFLDGMSQYLDRQGSLFQQWARNAQQLLQGVESAFARGINGILSGQMSLSQGIKAIWQGIVGTIVQAIAQLIAKWIVMSVVKKALGIADAATDAGRTSGALTTAAAETWEAYAWLPFAGPALAMAQIETMYASMGASVAASEGIGASVIATGRAVGGRVDRPELTLLGEAGPEIVAPESSFADYTRSIIGLGASLGANLSAADTQVMGYGRQAAGYAAGAPRGAGMVFNFNGPVMDTSDRGMENLGNFVMGGLQVAARRRGQVLDPSQMFGARI